MAQVFDAVASSFERFRALPDGVPEAIRSAVFAATRIASPAKVLDLGAGTGRIGKAFIAAGDPYTGADTSFAMLREFQASMKAGFLAQADGSQMPFHDGAFDMVLLMHVLSGTQDWREIVKESRRVVRTGGAVVVGHTLRAESGIDGKLKRQLRSILEEMGIPWQRPAESRHEALASLELHSTRYVHAEAASWSVRASAQEFLLRHRTGARFASLPAPVQDIALGKLTEWAAKTFGALDAAFDEQHSFELDVFEF
jgi:ubiquinone/menaquinone biosynthesis C-methylase UbiE